MNIWTIITLLFIYYLLIKPVLRSMSFSSLPKGNAEVFLRTLYKVAGDVAHADGEESAEELNAIVAIVRNAFGNPNLPAEQIIADYRRHSRQPFTRADAQQLSPRFRAILLQVAVQVAASNHRIDPEEITRIRKIAATLEIPPQMVDRLLDQLRGASSSRTSSSGSQVSAVDYALEVMELKSGATWQQIQRQYKKLAMKLHPDRAKKENKEEATEKFKELGDAYRILKERFG